MDDGPVVLYSRRAEHIYIEVGHSGASKFIIAQNECSTLSENVVHTRPRTITTFVQRSINTFVSSPAYHLHWPLVQNRIRGMIYAISAT